MADAERERGVVIVVKTMKRACASNVGGVVEGYTEFRVFTCTGTRDTQV